MLKPDITCLLFDKDGTILDFYKTWIPINRDMASDAAGGDSDLMNQLLRAGGHDPETDVIAPGSALAGASMHGIAGAWGACRCTGGSGAGSCIGSWGPTICTGLCGDGMYTGFCGAGM